MCADHSVLALLLIEIFSGLKKFTSKYFDCWEWDFSLAGNTEKALIHWSRLYNYTKCNDWNEYCEYGPENTTDIFLFSCRNGVKKTKYAKKN